MLRCQPIVKNWKKKMTKNNQYWFKVTNPQGESENFLAETKFEAIEKMVKKDGYKFSNSKYKAKKVK